MAAMPRVAIIQNNLAELSPLSKLYYLGPMFRQERPQAGRLRQFHQFAAEAIGSQSPHLDVEVILLAMEIYRQLGIVQTELAVNSVGCEKCRPKYKELLVAELNKLSSALSPESQARLVENPLRVLDSKSEQDKAAKKPACPLTETVAGTAYARCNGNMRDSDDRDV